MPTHTIQLECPVHRSFRTAQVAGMFDVPLKEKLKEEFTAELPSLELQDDAWHIGLIVGPSGSGKSSVAREAFGATLWKPEPWATDKAVIDGFGDLPTKQIVQALTAVGFSSPPSWIKPFHVLSNGEKFRCELAKALLLGGNRSNIGQDARQGIRPIVCFDEFTSVVDRNVAKICSAAVARSIRRGQLPVRLVAVTCHYDVAEWLEADWVLDMATGQLSRRRLRRPAIDLAIHRCELGAWKLFARHHYLSHSLALQSRCYMTLWRNEPVAFAATLPVIGRKGHRRFTRVVTLPDYQGIGIGMATIEAVAALHHEENLRINITSSHPALIAHCHKSKKWRTVHVKKHGSSSKNGIHSNYRSSSGRAVVSFEFRRNVKRVQERDPK